MAYLVGTATPLPTGATRVAKPSDVPWSTLAPGSRVLVSPGTYSGITTIGTQGTSASPVTVDAFDPANPPVLTDSVDLQGAAWVQLSHLVVHAPTFAGFVIRRGSHHVTVADSRVESAPIGLTVTDGAGTGHRLLRNTVTDSATQGLSIEVNGDPAERTLIDGNTVTRSGQHGLELRASHLQVEHNVVSASGQASGGASGIHVFSGSASEDSGDDNLVRYNASYANADLSLFDGNGIEVDQWCDFNDVSFNLVWGNDGAGVIVYDGVGNRVVGNTAWDDGRDPGGTHVARGEFIVASSVLARSAGNVVFDNLAVPTRSGVPGLYVDSGSLAGVALGGGFVGPNLLQPAAGGLALRWGDGGAATSAAQVNAASGTTGNVVVAPAFVDGTAPLADGLRLSAQPSSLGTLVAGSVDRLGHAALTGWAFFGAYFTAP